MKNWARRNRLTLMWSTLVIVVGALIYSPTEPSSAAFFFAYLAGLLLTATLDNRRLVADIRAGRDRL